MTRYSDICISSMRQIWLINICAVSLYYEMFAFACGLLAIKRPQLFNFHSLSIHSRPNSFASCHKRELYLPPPKKNLSMPFSKPLHLISFCWKVAFRTFDSLNTFLNCDDQIRPKVGPTFPSPQGEMYSNRFIAGSGVHKLPSTPFCLLGQNGVLQKKFKPGRTFDFDSAGR